MKRSGKSLERSAAVQEEKQQMANWQSVLLCQNECVRRRRKVESDERKEIRSDLIWNHKSCQKMRRSLAELCGSEKLPAKRGNGLVLLQWKGELCVLPRWAGCAQNPKLWLLEGEEVLLQNGVNSLSVLGKNLAEPAAQCSDITQT